MSGIPHDRKEDAMTSQTLSVSITREPHLLGRTVVLADQNRERLQWLYGPLFQMAAAEVRDAVGEHLVLAPATA
jgi:hypothetical protein